MDPIHPGEILKEDFLEERNMTPAQLADELFIPAETIEAICRSEKPITDDIARKLAVFFGNSPEFWTSLQQRYYMEIIE